ncbi:MAG TPA: response regulator [Thermoanaerobaculia bacterium]|jgi:CheY-like chemotaxis protein|nr:response regulator [Thermoanaerobaculia bacterium]
MKTPYILIVDDDPGVRALLVALLTHRGYGHALAEDGDEAIGHLRRSCPDAVLLDLMLPNSNGFEVLRFVRAERPEMLSRIIVLTAASNATLRDFDRSGIRALIRKPFDIHQLLAEIDGCCGMVPLFEERSLGAAAAE